MKDDDRDLRPFFALMRDRLRVWFQRVVAGENLFSGKCKISHSHDHDYCCADLYIKEPLVNTLRVLEQELHKHIPSRTRSNFHLSFESTTLERARFYSKLVLVLFFLKPSLLECTVNRN